ncbi:6-bladed beta-propeller [Filimonas effusa]|uniref:6-bladed beta-propeller n=1 Tax=Filimonas effusa TaxID=2508721 RepID=A0A4Q1D7S4_9BACT|nr:6-bladed beta-propeller [Filimonas effusa]RXK83811.1 6-bladed beta-propeller [Filimonas effusa]
MDKPAQSVMLFNREGKFIRRIGRAGSGKGQFMEITDMVYYPETNLIEIFSLPERKLLRFNTSGELMNEVLSEFYFLAFYHSKDGYWVYGCFPENKKKGVFEFRGNKYNLLLLSEDLKTAKSGFCESRNFFDRTSNNDNFQVNDEGELFFHYGYDNIVYKLKNKEAIPYWFLDFGKNRLPYDHIVTLSTRKQFDQAISPGAVKYDGLIYNLRIGSNQISLSSSEFGSLENSRSIIVNITDSIKVRNYTKIESVAQGGLLPNPIHFNHNKAFFIINPRMMNEQELTTLMREYHIKTNNASNLILLIVDENNIT